MKGKKRRFRKVWFVCCDNSVMSEYKCVNAFSTQEHALQQEALRNRQEMDNATKMWNQGKERRVHKAQGFYLVHESLFDEILKAWAKKQ
ncbi:hypothetical protein IDJ77_11305 [Mucilaginibacter sp. ZT4R22]|uniref:Uncharacterized protein n=1 Tax=Mucilaginibacter pankratovii TaxID=2772110 RepID=A0ABR7WPZ5_9SPHI|nr:hypothetical protein [Mucilaginibacter pankratovii]MBD1364396.1 hypothetical protein [Mucilaginibacter pankratovii]